MDMNCEDFDTLMAEALGDELPASKRPAFEAHLAECPNCRRDYETARRTVEIIKALPRRRRATVQRKGGRFVIQAEGTTVRGKAPVWSTRRRRRRFFQRGNDRIAGLFRYVASVLIAFMAGYAVHAAIAGSKPPATGVFALRPGGVRTTSPPPANSLQGALLNAHLNGPQRSDLAKLLIAMAGEKR